MSVPTPSGGVSPSAKGGLCSNKPSRANVLTETHFLPFQDQIPVHTATGRDTSAAQILPGAVPEDHEGHRSDRE